MNNIEEIEYKFGLLVFDINPVGYLIEPSEEYVKYTIVLKNDRMFVVDVNKTEIEDLRDNVFVFSYFKNRELQYGNYLEFDIIIKFIKEIANEQHR